MAPIKLVPIRPEEEKKLGKRSKGKVSKSSVEIRAKAAAFILKEGNGFSIAFNTARSVCGSSHAS